MKLAYLTSVYPRATDTFIRTEILCLRERGHVIHTFSVRRVEPSQLVSEEIRNESKQTTYLLSDRWSASPLAAARCLASSPRRFFAALWLAFRTRAPGVRALLWQVAYFLEAAVLAVEIRVRRVEHLHNHIGESSASVAMLASALSGIPFSLTIHGPYVFRAPERWALGTKIERSAFTVCISEFTRSQCMVHVPLHQWHRLQIVRCGPALDFLSLDPVPAPARPRVFWVGRMCEEKGIPVLVEAARRLAETGLDFELTLAGDGPLRPLIERQIEKHGLASRVRLAGWLSSEGVRKELEHARVLVVPSFAEGLPVVIMEALAMARPVVATYIAGIPELVEPRKNGWLVPAGAVEPLAQAIREAIEMPLEDLRRMGAAGREKVLCMHDARREAARLERLFFEAREGARVRGGEG